MIIAQRVRLGDIWKLGPHRILCGDSTDREQVARLIDGKRASLTVTSPPYNLGHSARAQYAGKQAVMPSRPGKYATSQDSLSEPAYLNLLVKVTENALAHSEVAIIVLQQLAGNKVALQEYLHCFRHHLIDTAIWYKASAAPAIARRVMNSRFEFIYFLSPRFWPKRSIPTASFHGTVDNVYSGSIQRHNAYFTVHAATFPLHLPRWLIETFDATKGIILDPFLGTGTTLIAAQELGRVCYGMEIEPIYCDIVLDRWEKTTAASPVLISSGKR